MTEKLIRKVWIAVSAAALGMRGRLLLYRRGRRDARHNTAYYGRRAGRLPAGALRRRDGTRPRSQGVYVDLRSGLAAEPAQPQRDGQRRPPYRLQPASGRQHRRVERRALRRDRQAAGRRRGASPAGSASKTRTSIRSSNSWAAKRSVSRRAGW